MAFVCVWYISQVFSGTPKDEVNVKGFCPYWTPQQVQQRLNTEGGDLELDLDKQRYPHSRVDRPQSWSFRGTSTPSFTFVREPLGHFISGLSEAYYRSRNERYARASTTDLYSPYTVNNGAVCGTE